MPKAFEECRAKGGKIRTIHVGNSGKYMHICILNGKSFPGEVKEKKNGKRTKS